MPICETVSGVPDIPSYVAAQPPNQQALPENHAGSEKGISLWSALREDFTERSNSDILSAMSVIVKICGITNLEDGKASAEAGADALGFVFWERSPRSVSIGQAAEIIRSLPPMTVKVGVFVDPPTELVLRAISDAGINLLQFHGAEPPDFCTQFGIMCIKAFRIRDEASLEQLDRYDTHAWLLDAYTAGAPGGTGERFDWDLAVRAREMGRPIFLAGGLTPSNVAEAVTKVMPYGVDVSSGVEFSPGRKDHAKVKAFIHAARAAA